jgi:diadenosine tetraphosphate (Ap4A) HIT family hydrolase
VSKTLLRCAGGELALPSADLLLATRSDGGNLVVHPPRPVWERSELTAQELTRFSFLVAAAGRAMLDALPQLDGGCINYWEAGNWALNDAAEPPGRKRAREFRRMHLHLLGRSPAAANPHWAWGESPRFPAFADRHTWSAGFERLDAGECRAIVARAESLLMDRYGLARGDVTAGAACATCGYPTPLEPGRAHPSCAECA